MTNKQRSEAQDLAAKVRALHALSCLMQLVVTAKHQTDTVTWQRVGGLEAEDFLDALERGGLHPLLQAYEQKKATGGRAGPSLRERHFRRLAVLLSTALQRSGLDKRKARKQTAKALAGLLRSEPTQRVIEHWELELEPPLSSEDESMIGAALARCRNDSKALVRHFLGFVRFPWAFADSREGAGLIGNRNMPEDSR